MIHKTLKAAILCGFLTALITKESQGSNKVLHIAEGELKCEVQRLIC